MSYEYGTGKGINDLLKLSYKPILYTFLFLIPTIFIGWIILPFFVNWLLPKYVMALKQPAGLCCCCLLQYGVSTTISSML